MCTKKVLAVVNRTSKQPGRAFMMGDELTEINHPNICQWANGTIVEIAWNIPEKGRPRVVSIELSEKNTVPVNLLKNTLVHS